MCTNRFVLNQEDITNITVGSLERFIRKSQIQKLFLGWYMDTSVVCAYGAEKAPPFLK